MVTKKSKTKQQLILEIEELRNSLDVMERRMQAGAGELRRCAEARLKEKKEWAGRGSCYASFGGRHATARAGIAGPSDRIEDAERRTL